MDRLETADILAVLKAAYPQFYNGLSPKEANKIVDLWAEMFKDEPVIRAAWRSKPTRRSNTKPPIFPVHTICQSLPKRQTASLAERAAS